MCVLVAVLVMGCESAQLITSPISKVIDNPVTRWVGQPVKKAIDNPVTRWVGRPIKKAVDNPITNIVTDPIGKAIKMPIEMVFGSKPVEKESTPLIAPTDAYRIGFTPRWACNLTTPRGAYISHATIMGDVLICIERPTNIVTALEVRSGTLRWQKVIGSKLDILFEAVRYNKDQILISSETELFVIAADNGRLIRRSPLESTVKDRPVVVNDYAVFGGLNGNIFGHHITAGYSHWQYQMTSGVVVRPVNAGVNVFVTDSNGVYAMVKGTNGKVLWKGRTYKRSTATPAVNSINIFLASEDQTLYALNRLTGSDTWKHRSDSPLKTSPIIIENTLFQHEPDVGLTALDASSGKLLWRHRGTAKPVSLSRGHLLLYEPGRIIALDPPSGKSIAQVSVTPLKSILNGPAGSLILLTNNGRLVRLDPQR